MNNPYSAEWQKINQIANNVNALQLKIQELEKIISTVNTQLSNLPYKTDKNGNDVNKAQREALRTRINELNKLINETNQRKQELSNSAHSMALAYKQQASAYGQETSKVSNSSTTFQNLSGYRFARNTASAGNNFTQQRSKHYGDFVTLFNNLATAAELAALGRKTSENTQTISERGTFNNPNAIYNATKSIGDGINNVNLNTILNGNEENIVKKSNDSAINAMFSKLGIEGISSEKGVPNFDAVSHAKVEMQMKGVGMIAAADAMLAKKLGITGEEAANYRKENGLEWRDDGSGQMANLVPQSISNEYGDGKEKASEPTPKEALNAYMCAHNYGSKDMSKYMKDPEWKKLHASVFPNYKPDFLELISNDLLSGTFEDMVRYSGYSEKPKVVDKKHFEECVTASGLICFRTFKDMDSKDGKISAHTFKNKFLNDSEINFQYNPAGLKTNGDGIYCTINRYSQKEGYPEKQEIELARKRSLSYGDVGKRATACITLDVNSNLVAGEKLLEEFEKMTYLEKKKFQEEELEYKTVAACRGIASYAIAKGYDGAIWTHRNGDRDITIYNRKKMIILDDAFNVDFGIE